MTTRPRSEEDRSRTGAGTGKHKRQRLATARLPENPESPTVDELWATLRDVKGRATLRATINILLHGRFSGFSVARKAMLRGMSEQRLRMAVQDAPSAEEAAVHRAWVQRAASSSSSLVSSSSAAASSSPSSTTSCALFSSSSSSSSSSTPSAPLSSSPSPPTPVIQTARPESQALVNLTPSIMVDNQCRRLGHRFCLEDGVRVFLKTHPGLRTAVDMLTQSLARIKDQKDGNLSLVRDPTGILYSSFPDLVRVLSNLPLTRESLLAQEKRLCEEAGYPVRIDSRAIELVELLSQRGTRRGEAQRHARLREVLPSPAGVVAQPRGVELLKEWSQTLQGFLVTQGTDGLQEEEVALKRAVLRNLTASVSGPKSVE